MLRQSVDISAAAVLLAALTGAAVLGVVGALVAIPVAAALKVVLVQQLDHYEARAAPVAPLPHLPLRRRRHERDPAELDEPDERPEPGERPGG